MKCPFCKSELQQSKKNPEYILCYSCKKKFKKPQQMILAEEKKRQREEDIYAEEERKLSAKRAKAKSREMLPQDSEEFPDIQDQEDEGRGFSKVLIVFLGIAILAVAAAIVYLLM